MDQIKARKKKEKNQWLLRKHDVAFAFYLNCLRPMWEGMVWRVHVVEIA